MTSLSSFMVSSQPSFLSAPHQYAGSSTWLAYNSTHASNLLKIALAILLVLVVISVIVFISQWRRPVDTVPGTWQQPGRFPSDGGQIANVSVVTGSRGVTSGPSTGQHEYQGGGDDGTRNHHQSFYRRNSSRAFASLAESNRVGLHGLSNEQHEAFAKMAASRDGITYLLSSQRPTARDKNRMKIELVNDGEEEDADEREDPGHRYRNASGDEDDDDEARNEMDEEDDNEDNRKSSSQSRSLVRKKEDRKQGKKGTGAAGVNEPDAISRVSQLYSRVRTTAIYGKKTNRSPEEMRHARDCPHCSKASGGGGAVATGKPDGEEDDKKKRAKRALTCPYINNGISTLTSLGNVNSGYTSYAASQSAASLGSCFTGGVDLTNTAGTLFQQISFSNLALVDINQTGDPTNVFDQDTFLAIRVALAANATSEATPQSNIAGWMLNNARAAIDQTSLPDLDTLIAEINDQPAWTTQTSTLAQSILDELARQQALMLNSINHATANQVLNDDGSIVNSGAGASSNQGSGSDAISIFSPGEVDTSSPEAALTLALAQTYMSKMYMLQQWITPIMGRINSFCTFAKMIQVATSTASLSVAEYAAFTDLVLKTVPDYMQEIANAMLNTSDFDGMDSSIPAVGVTRLSRVQPTGILQIWQTVVGGDQAVFQTATINNLWLQYLYFDAIITSGLLLWLEALHYPIVPSISNVRAIITGYNALLDLARQTYAPTIPPLTQPVIVVMDENQDGLPYSRRSGTVWLLIPPPNAANQFLWSYTEAPTVAASININGITGWQLPSTTEIRRLLDTAGEIESPLTDSLTGASAAAIVPQTELAYLRELGFARPDFVVVPGTLSDIRFWTRENTMAYIPAGSTDLLYSVPQGLANIWATRPWNPTDQ